MFTLPPNNCEELEPTCRYRQIYMRENHLRQNLLHNRCSTTQLITRNGFRRQFEIFQGKYMILSQNPYAQASRPMIIILDMEDDMKEVDRTECLLENTGIDLLQALGNTIIVVQHDFFQMFNFVQGSLTLADCKILVNDEAVSLTMPVTDIRSSSSRNDLMRWYIKNRQQAYYECSSSLVDNKYCVTLAATHHPYHHYQLHFWEIYSANKLGMIPVPTINQQTIPFDMELNVIGDNIYIILHLETTDDDEDNTQIYGRKVMSFRLKALGVPEFCVDIPHGNAVYFTGKYIAIFPVKEDITRYKIIDTTKGGAVSTIQVAHNINWQAVDVYRNQLAFACGSYVHLLNTDTMQESAILSIDNEGGVLTYLKFINSEFLQVWKSSEFNCNAEVWDLKSSCKLYSLRPTNVEVMEGIVENKGEFPKIYFMICELESLTVYVINYW